MSDGVRCLEDRLVDTGVEYSCSAWDRSNRGFGARAWRVLTTVGEQTRSAVQVKHFDERSLLLLLLSWCLYG